MPARAGYAPYLANRDFMRSERPTLMSLPRYLAVAVAVAGLSLAGCSAPSDGPGPVVHGTGTTTAAATTTDGGPESTRTAPTAAPTGGPSSSGDGSVEVTASDGAVLVGGLPAAVELGSWWHASGSMPQLPGDDWLYGCGAGSGVAELQSDDTHKFYVSGSVMAAARIASYPDGMAEDITGLVSGLVADCPAGGAVHMSLTSSPSSPADTTAVLYVDGDMTTSYIVGAAGGDTLEVVVMSSVLPKGVVRQLGVDLFEQVYSKATGGQAAAVPVPGRSAGDSSGPVDGQNDDGRGHGGNGGDSGTPAEEGGTPAPGGGWVVIG